MASSITKNLKNSILDTLFPIFCCSCQKEGFWLCQNCLSQIKILDFQVCPSCEDIITDKGFLCPTCRDGRKSHIDSLVVAVSYEDSFVKKLVHNFKYRFIPDISKPLAELMIKSWLRNDASLPDFLIPVPLHPKRLRWRGFNQSLMLAMFISHELAPPMKIDILDILERTRYRSPQMGIKNYEDRLLNVRDIFAFKKTSDLSLIKNKSVLLIDDIATTGATLEECAKILKLAGAKKVFTAVIARQSVKK